MNSVIGVVDYGKAGNIFNVSKAIEEAGAKVKIVKSDDDFKGIDKIVLPGVGTFKDAMMEIGKLKETLTDQMKNKYSLGICLGMQILSKIGYEFGETEGLGIIDAEVKKIEVKGKVPHIGWTNIEQTGECRLLKNIEVNDMFYFMHSYEVVNYTEVKALSKYCNHKFVSVVGKDNIFGVQFHPEKSREAGIRVLQNFISL